MNARELAAIAGLSLDADKLERFAHAIAQAAHRFAIDETPQRLPAEPRTAHLERLTVWRDRALRHADELAELADEHDFVVGILADAFAGAGN